MLPTSLTAQMARMNISPFFKVLPACKILKRKLKRTLPPLMEYLLYIPIYKSMFVVCDCVDR